MKREYKPFSATLLNSRVRNLLDMRRKLVRMIVGKAKDEERGMPAGEVRLSKLDEEFIRRFTDVVTEHISQDKLDIPFMADKMNMSVSTLYRKLKGLTGLSGNEFIRKIKLKRSLYLMTEQGLNVTEAAYSSGFNDVGHFRRCFKEEYGVSPSKYTKR
ncbi:helix-turn-helix domain-containing protein [Paraprevotella xylaniphila]